MSKIKIDEESVSLFFQTYKKMLQAQSDEEKIDKLAHFYETVVAAEDYFGINLKDKIGNLDD